MERLFQAIREWFINLAGKFQTDFIVDNRWRFLTNGLAVTLEVAFFAVILGIVIGFIVAIIRAGYDRSRDSAPVRRKKGRKRSGPVNLRALFSVAAWRRLGRGLFSFANWLCKVYLTVIRGTPVVLQLLIIYFVIFGSTNISKVFVAIVAFGINSGAYVAEIVRSGIMSIDQGQMEAGRSLGLNYIQTMWHIIIPQAFKNVLPALGNEFIVLLKETSVSGYIALEDLTKGGDIIRGRTFDAFLPLFAVAIIYLAIVMLLSYGVSRLERRLRSSEH